MEVNDLFIELNNILVSLEESSKYELTQENLNALNQYDNVLIELKRNSNKLSYSSVQLLETLPGLNTILSNQRKVQTYNSWAKRAFNSLVGLGLIVILLSLFIDIEIFKKINIKLIVIASLFLSYIGEWVAVYIIRTRYGNDEIIKSIRIIIKELTVVF